LDSFEDAGDEELGFGDESGDKSEKPFDDEPFDAGVEADEDEDPEKFIQQLAGKLGTSLRKYNDERGEPDLELEKYAINSVISASHTADMDEEDQKDIIKKVKTSGAGDDDVDKDIEIDKDVDVNIEEPSGDDEELDFGSEEELEENDMLTQNLKNMKDDADEILSMDKGELKKKLRGHDWALDHISTSTDDTEEVADFLTTEEGYIALGDDIEIVEGGNPIDTLANQLAAKGDDAIAQAEKLIGSMALNEDFMDANWSNPKDMEDQKAFNKANQSNANKKLIAGIAALGLGYMPMVMAAKQVAVSMGVTADFSDMSWMSTIAPMMLTTILYKVLQEVIKNAKERAKASWVRNKGKEVRSRNTEEGYIALGDDIEITEDEDPCWDGYEMVGMKEKGGKEVPNCVPVDENNSMYEEWSRPMEISEGIGVSEELQYHLDNKIALGENVFRYGSESYLNLLEEVKNLYEQNLINLNENDELIINDFINESGDFDGSSVLLDIIHEDFQINEAEYKGKEVELNKPKRGGSKKFYVYVKDGDKVKKVSFGAKSGGGNLAVKLKDPKARKAFADRHNCETKNDKTTPGYWSCRLPRYAKMLGLSGGGTWW
jgi:hypothetical protein